MAPVFRALGDANRRLLLDRLFERDGQTLGELTTHLPGMTRFGVMKHLTVLEDAGLVTTQRAGREKRHYLNPVGIRLIHDRWISKYAAPVVGAMTTIKHRVEGDFDGRTGPRLHRIHPRDAGADLARHHRRRRHRSATTTERELRPTGRSVRR